jgi:hypothetical protein
MISVETGGRREPHPARAAEDFSYGGGEMYEAAPLSSEQIGAAQEMNARLRCKGAADFNDWLAEQVGRRDGHGLEGNASAAIAHAPLRVSAATTESHPIVAAKDEQPRDPFRLVTCWRNPMT